MKKLKIGTRGSQLALWQAHRLATKLSEIGVASEIHIVKTTGDARTDVPLKSIGGKGLFIKELEDALERGAVDLAVHSLKDVPSIIPDQFALVGFLERADPRDAWLQPQGIAIGDLPAGSVIGTSAPRRRAQIRQRYPHLQMMELRGNVDTRVNKLKAGQCSALVLASAGLDRLERSAEITSRFSVEEMIPASGQGIVGIEIFRGRDDVAEIARRITHEPSRLAALCERGVLQKFGARLDCYSAIAVHASVDDGTMTIRSFLSDTEGETAITAMLSRAVAEHEQLVGDIAKKLISQGAIDLLEAKAV